MAFSIRLVQGEKNCLREITRCGFSNNIDCFCLPCLCICLVQARLEEDRAEQPGCTGTLHWIQLLYDDYLYFGSNVICQYILNIRIHFWDVLVVMGCCLSDDVRRGCVILGQLDKFVLPVNC